MRKSRFLLVLMIVVFISPLLSDKTKMFDPAKADAYDPHTIVKAVGDEPDSLDPAWIWGGYGLEVVLNLYETLVSYDGNCTDRFVPVLSTEVPSLENGLISDDGLTYTFPIKSGVEFHNGETLTPEDVEYSFERAMVQDRAYVRPRASYGPAAVALLLEPLLGIKCTRDWATGKIVVAFEEIDKAVDSNSTHVFFHLKKPHAPFLSELCAQVAYGWGHIVNKKFCIDHGDWPGTADNWTLYNNPEMPPLQEIACGTGPFELESWDHGEQVVLVRNEEYWKELAKIERVILQRIPDWAQRKAMFEAGEVDICELPSLYRSEERATARQELAILGGIRNHQYESGSVLGTFFNFRINLTSPYIWSGRLDGNGIPPNFFEDKETRLGFAYSFDRQEYLENEWRGEARIVETPLVEKLLYHNPEQNGYTLNLTIAEECFRKAWGGQLWEKGFVMTLPYNNETRSTFTKASFEILKRNIESLNSKFVLHVNGIDSAQFSEDLLPNSNLPIISSGWWPDFLDPHNIVEAYMHSQRSILGGLQHYGGHVFDSLVVEGAMTMDPSQRSVVYFQLQRGYVEECLSFTTVWLFERHFERIWVRGWLSYVLGGEQDYFYAMWKSVADISGDCVINISDLSIVAVAFSSNLGDPRWNLEADLNGDKTVNIIDVTMVAKDYGKTV